jgi:hypothetical protein
MVAIEIFVNTLMAYALAGLLFGIAFVASGIHRLDHLAKGSGIGFRLLVLPGSAALWPFLLVRWLGLSDRAPVERNAHRDQARAGGCP